MRDKLIKGARAALFLSLLAMFACEGTTPTTTAGTKGKKSPAPSASASPKGSPNATGESPSPSPTPTGSPKASPTPTGSPKSSASPSASPKASASPSPSSSPKSSASPSASPSGSAQPSASPTAAGSALPSTGLKSYPVAGDDFPAITDGAANQAEFGNPTAMVADAAGNLYVADADNSCIRKITLGATVSVSTYAGDKQSGANGYVDDPDPFKARFNYPKGLAIDAAGNLYVGDTGNNCVRMIAAGSKAVTTVAGSPGAGLKNDAGTAAQFSGPIGLAVDGTKLYVADTGNAQIRMVDLADNTHPVSTYAGGTAGIKNDADATKALFNSPYALALGPDKKLYVLEALNHRIRVIDPSGTKAVSTFAGPAESVNPGAEGDTDATDTANARFNFQTGGSLCFGPDGSLYVADSGNARIKKITGGQVSRLAGDGTITSTSSRHGSYKDDTGGMAALSAEYDRPIGLALVNGALYVADSGNFRIRVLK
jgi:sugar lactone lactonase YvrE